MAKKQKTDKEKKIPKRKRSTEKSTDKKKKDTIKKRAKVKAVYTLPEDKSEKALKAPARKAVQGFIDCAEAYTQLIAHPIAYNEQEIYPAEAQALKTLNEHEALNLTQLADKLGITKSGALKTTNKLIDKNLLSKKKSEECGREVTLELTETGKELAGELPKLKSAHTEPMLEVFTTFPKHTQLDLIAAFDQILTGIKKANTSAEAENE